MLLIQLSFQLSLTTTCLCIFCQTSLYMWELEAFHNIAPTTKSPMAINQYWASRLARGGRGLQTLIPSNSNTDFFITVSR